MAAVHWRSDVAEIARLCRGIVCRMGGLERAAAEFVDLDAPAQWPNLDTAHVTVKMHLGMLRMLSKAGQ